MTLIANALGVAGLVAFLFWLFFGPIDRFLTTWQLRRAERAAAARYRARRHSS